MKKVLRNLWNGALIGVTLGAIAYILYVLCWGFNYPYVNIGLLRASAVWCAIVSYCNLTAGGKNNGSDETML